jgi:hypothetical protein
VFGFLEDQQRLYRMHLISNEQYATVMRWMRPLWVVPTERSLGWFFLVDQPRLYSANAISVEQYATVMRAMRPLWVMMPHVLFNPEVMLVFHLDRGFYQG